MVNDKYVKALDFMVNLLIAVLAMMLEERNVTVFHNFLEKRSVKVMQRIFLAIFLIIFGMALEKKMMKT